MNIDNCVVVLSDGETFEPVKDVEIVEIPESLADAPTEEVEGYLGEDEPQGIRLDDLLETAEECEEELAHFIQDWERVVDTIPEDHGVKVVLKKLQTLLHIDPQE